MTYGWGERRRIAVASVVQVREDDDDDDGGSAIVQGILPQFWFTERRARDHLCVSPVAVNEKVPHAKRWHHTVDEHKLQLIIP